MSEIFRKIKILSKIDDNLKKDIKYLHVFDDRVGYNVLFVSTNDQVYYFGNNSNGCSGLGHNNKVDSNQIIPELCGKKVKQFFIGLTFVLALSSDNLVFSWGQNEHGQLGNCQSKNERAKKFSKPGLVILPKNQKIVGISCGSNHSMILTAEGNVYVCGCNQFGQTLGLNTNSTNIYEPELLDFSWNSIIKVIYCQYNQSYALTEDGKVFTWGQNHCLESGPQYCEQRCVNKPSLIDISNVIAVCPSKTNTYYLNTDGHIYFTGKYKNNKNEVTQQELPKKLLIDDYKFDSLHSIPYYKKRGPIPIAINREGIHFLFQNEVQTHRKSLLDFVSINYFITHQTIDLKINHEQLDNLVQTFEQLNLDDHTNNINVYSDNFEEIETIGSSNFDVYKVLEKSSQKHFAVKKIDLRKTCGDKSMVKEIDLHKSLDQDYVVQYIKSWSDNHYCYIQMELCDCDLEEIIKYKQQIFDRKQTDLMTSMEYFISSQIFKELLECVQYLHEFKPKPIIHRDLKPQNVLIKNDSKNGKFLKLCDFGISTYDGNRTANTHTDGVGTAKYIAPEVHQGKYSIQADIYSLAVIFGELFAFDINENYEQSITSNPQLSQKWKSIIKIVDSMYCKKYSERPNCKEILSRSTEWLLSYNELKQTADYKDFFKQIEKNLKRFENKFFFEFLTQKLCD